MEAICTSWCDSGSEQVASNYAIANSPDPAALPLPTYSGFGPSEPAPAIGETNLLLSFHRRLSLRHSTLPASAKRAIAELR